MDSRSTTPFAFSEASASASEIANSRWAFMTAIQNSFRSLARRRQRFLLPQTRIAGQTLGMSVVMIECSKGFEPLANRANDEFKLESRRHTDEETRKDSSDPRPFRRKSRTLVGRRKLGQFLGVGRCFPPITILRPCSTRETRSDCLSLVAPQMVSKTSISGYFAKGWPIGFEIRGEHSRLRNHRHSPSKAGNDSRSASLRRGPRPCVPQKPDDLGCSTIAKD